MAQIVDEIKQAELIPARVSETSGTYRVTLSSQLNNSQLILIGDENGQHSELDAGDSIDVPGDALPDVYLKGTPTDFDITDVIQGSKLFKFLGDQTDQIVAGDMISVVGSTGNDGFYTVAAVSFGTGKTSVEVVEAIPDATADGDLFHADHLILFARG